MKFNQHSGKTYEDQYGGWLEFFRIVAESEDAVTVEDVPRCWVPLLSYLGARVDSAITFFPCDELIDLSAYDEAERRGLVREYVESVCCFRPELVDAMWKSDMEWNTRCRMHVNNGEFVVTNNGSFHRPEVLEQMARLAALELPKKTGCVLVPCAADKPYPAPLHVAVRAVIPDSFRIAIVTGVLGVVPEEAWPWMLRYDSGVPNRWRVQEAVYQHFKRHNYQSIIVFSDFYSEAIAMGLSRLSCNSALVDFPLERAGVWNRGDAGYLNLVDPRHLALLRKACK